MRIEKLAAMLLAGSGILFSSCNDRIETETPTASEAWGNEIRAELTGVGDIQTRSHNVYMYEVRWDAGDQIYVKDAMVSMRSSHWPTERTPPMVCSVRTVMRPLHSLEPSRPSRQLK